MSQSIRQSELFAGNDWKVIYQAFTQINFNASDPPSINRAMREYIRSVYPEDFNDWIESSEFVAIIDLLSWLAGNLAFKTDINARENFLETAESRESVLRLARFLSYQPKRCTAARGLLKIVEIESDDDISDAFGASLSNTGVRWGENDPEWFDRFITIINSSLTLNNQFGAPIKDETLGGFKTQQYRFNNRLGDGDVTFSTIVSGERMSFDVVNADFEDGGFFERDPNPDGALHLVYRNDGNGNDSPNTGFFLMFKQGKLARENFQISSATENLVLDLNASNINDSDVWVQSLDDLGRVLTTWNKVPAVATENITFNSLPVEERNIFAAVTRDQDRVSIRFSDGRFGNAPIGNIGVTYRVSNGLQYTIKPNDIDRIQIPISYFNRNGVRRTVRVTVSLQNSISNAAPRETELDIKRRAPGVYASQNRMVSGDDYNRFPLQSGAALKIKAVNRTYSGHSRFIDLNDPTGTYQDVSVFADDGAVFQEPANGYLEIPQFMNKTPTELNYDYLQLMLRKNETSNYVQDFILNKVRDNTAFIVPNDFTWFQSSAANFSSTGWFSGTNDLIQEGAYLKFKDNNIEKWVVVVSIGAPIDYEPETAVSGPVQISEVISTGSVLLEIVPRFAPVIDTDLSAEIEENFKNNISFTLWYDFTKIDEDKSKNPCWTIEVASNLDTLPLSNGTRVKVAAINFLSGGFWRMSTAGCRYVFESYQKVQWYFRGKRSTDLSTGIQTEDSIRVIKTNVDLRSPMGRALPRDYFFAIDSLYHYADGYNDPNRIIIRNADRDEDGFDDEPDTFYNIISSQPNLNRLFWYKVTDTSTLGSYRPIYSIVAYATETLLRNNGASGVVCYADDTKRFLVKINGSWVDQEDNYKTRLGRGLNVASKWYTGIGTNIQTSASPIDFHWKHYAPSNHRIDPSRTNIVDIFVLPRDYDFEVRQWVKNGLDANDKPEIPTERDLRIAFVEYEKYKTSTDHIVWRPVTYKPLFGKNADISLQSQFKVVKLPSTTLSDGEVRTRVIKCITDFFDATRWDFGETFYYTELAAYIHQQMATIIGSIVLVPLSESGTFGNGFEVKCRSDEMFLSTATVSDVVIINSNTANNLRIR